MLFEDILLIDTNFTVILGESASALDGGVADGAFDAGGQSRVGVGGPPERAAPLDGLADDHARGGVLRSTDDGRAPGSIRGRRPPLDDLGRRAADRPTGDGARRRRAGRQAIAVVTEAGRLLAAPAGKGQRAGRDNSQQPAPGQPWEPGISHANLPWGDPAFASWHRPSVDATARRDRNRPRHPETR